MASGSSPARQLTRISPRHGWSEARLRELWDHRTLIALMAWRDIRVRYKQTLLGAVWAVIHPLMTMLLFTLLFGRLARLPSEGLPYPIFYFSALLPWTYFTRSVTNGTGSLAAHARTVARVYFPRIALPVSAVLSPLVDTSMSFVVLVALMLWYGLAPTVTALAVVPFVLLAVMAALGVTLWLAALNGRYRDVTHTLTFGLQMWMFASPVVYPLSLVPEAWRWLYLINPMAIVVEGFRWSLTGQGDVALIHVVATFVWVTLLVGTGLLFFRQIEGSISDVL